MQKKVARILSKILLYGLKIPRGAGSAQRIANMGETKVKIICQGLESKDEDQYKVRDVAEGLIVIHEGMSLEELRSILLKILGLNENKTGIVPKSKILNSDSALAYANIAFFLRSLSQSIIIAYGVERSWREICENWQEITKIWQGVKNTVINNYVGIDANDLDYPIVPTGNFGETVPRDRGGELKFAKRRERYLSKLKDNSFIKEAIDNLKKLGNPKNIPHKKRREIVKGGEHTSCEAAKLDLELSEKAADSVINGGKGKGPGNIDYA